MCTVDSRTRRVNSPGLHVSEGSNGEREVKEITANYECKSSPWPSVAIESNLLITEDQPQDLLKDPGLRWKTPRLRSLIQTVQDRRKTKQGSSHPEPMRLPSWIFHLWALPPPSFFPDTSLEKLAPYLWRLCKLHRKNRSGSLGKQTGKKTVPIGAALLLVTKGPVAHAESF